MSQDRLVLTPCIFECVGKYRQSVEETLVVDDLGEFLNGAAVPRQPIGRKLGRRAERVAEDATQEVRLGMGFPLVAFVGIRRLMGTLRAGSVQGVTGPSDYAFSGLDRRIAFPSYAV